MNYALLALAKFYSRIVLKQLSRDLLAEYRSVEKDCKKLIRIKADLIYLSLDNEK